MNIKKENEIPSIQCNVMNYELNASCNNGGIRSSTVPRLYHNDWRMTSRGTLAVICLHLPQKSIIFFDTFTISERYISN